MRCQCINNGKRCFKEASKDIRIRAGTQGWRIFLCYECWREEVEVIQSYVKFLTQQDEVEQKPV